MNIQEIDFQPLWNWINRQLHSSFHFNVEFNGNKRPNITCRTNLQEFSGIFRSVVKEVTVDFFNFDFKEESGELWGTICLSYESWSGGSNGMQIGTAWFNPKTGWKFESCKERSEKNSNL